MERQHVDMLHRVSEALADPCHVLDVLLAGGEPRNQHETHPDLLAGPGQALPEVDGRLQYTACHLVVSLLVTGFDIQQTQIDIVKHLVRVIRVQKAGGIEAGMHAHLLGRMEYARDECRLHHRLAAGERDAAAGRLEQVGVTVDLLDHRLQIHRLAVTHLPCVGILAVLAAQRAAAHEHRHARARTVHGRVDVP